MENAPTVCMICFSHEHATQDCTTHIQIDDERRQQAKTHVAWEKAVSEANPASFLVAEAQDQSASHSYFAWFVAALAAVWATMGLLCHKVRDVLPPDPGAFKTAVTMGLIFWFFQYANGCDDLPRVSAKCYLGSSPGLTKNSPSTDHPEYIFE